MGTCEGVEKLSNGIDNSISTKKQNDLICTVLKTVPESWDYPKMKSYLENKTKSNATEFLNEFLERNADRIDGVKKLVSYYAERPGVEKLGKHGLFSQIDDKINFDAVADEVSNHNGIVWTHVISLTLAKLIANSCKRKRAKLLGQVDSKLKSKVEEKKLAHGLKTDRTVNQTEIENDEEQGFTMSM